MATSGPKRVVAPEPPARLGDIKLQLAEVPPIWFRLCPRRYRSPLFWSREGCYRFDSKDARWGVCYSATSTPAAFQEIFGNKIRSSSPLNWEEIKDISAWRITLSPSFRGLGLYGESLTAIGATLQCFVSSYPKSQRWAAALMNHPADLDGIVYLGRRCGVQCLAMFGDTVAPRSYQSSIQTDRLGNLALWDGFWPMLDRLGVRVSSIPGSISMKASWSS
jgi:hypothetical protein